MNPADTEALKALIAEIRLRFTSGNSIPVHDVRLNVDEWTLLERMLASQTQTADELPFMPTTNAAKPTEHMVDEALDGFNTMPATEGLRAQVEHAVERAMWACPVFAPPSKSVWALVDKWRDESGRTGIHSVLQFALMNHAIELDEALAAVPVASQMGEPDPPEIPEVLAPVYKFLMERCHYWQPIFDDESLPPAPWYGMVEIEIERSGKHEFCEAKYESGLFGGPPQWSSWNASESPWKPLRWLKKWNLKIGVYTGNDSQAAPAAGMDADGKSK